MPGQDFEEKADIYKDVYILTIDSTPRKTEKKWPLLVLVLLVLGFLFTNVISLLGALLVLFGVLFVMNYIDLRTLKRELDINLAGILVLSLAIGKAVINSGAGELISSTMISGFSSFGTGGLLLALMLLTALLTSFITNVAAVSIAFPVAFELAEIYPDHSGQFFLGIAFAASAAFLTPISYQTNIIVSGPAGYKFSDFTKTGLPLFILYLATVYGMLLIL